MVGLGFVFSKVKNYYPTHVWDDIQRRGYKDLKQNFFLELAVKGHPIKEKFNPDREIFRAANRAVYRTAKELGWRKPKGGSWNPPAWAMLEKEGL